ncbi:MAG TPA: YggT family protein [Candidatus Paceibacterota bacterium]
MDAYHSPTTKPLFRATQVVWYLCDLLEIILIFRFFLRFAGANPDAGFTSFVYSISWPFVEPFFAVFRTTVVAGSVVEWTTVLAMIVYSVIAWGIVSLLLMGKTVSTPEAAAALEDQNQTK